jgi:MazG family protein
MLAPMKTPRDSSHSTDAPAGHSFPELVEVMARLLAPGGCPWDREQTLETLRPYLVEEMYEVLDALERGDVAGHCEELGDLMMQIVFQAALRAAEGAFGIDDVIGSIRDKLVRRHPHVFSDASAKTSEEVLAQWSAIKAEERRDKGAPTDAPRALAGVPEAMPALARAQSLGTRAAAVGFDWPDVDGARAKVAEELAELDAARAGDDRAAVEAELGDLLLATVSLARKLDVDAEGALRAATRRFRERFEHIEDRLREAGEPIEEATMARMDALWDEAKGGGR